MPVTGLGQVLKASSKTSDFPILVKSIEIHFSVTTDFFGFELETWPSLLFGLF